MNEIARKKLREETRQRIQKSKSDNTENQKLLLEEYKIIQSKIDQYGNSFNVLKGFAIAFTGSFLIFSNHYLSANSIEFYILSFLILYIMFLEIQNRTYFDKLISRALEIEKKYHKKEEIRPIDTLRIGTNLTQVYFTFKLLIKTHRQHLHQLIIYYVLIMIIVNSNVKWNPILDNLAITFKRFINA